jgi:hypothetical protein
LSETYIAIETGEPFIDIHTIYEIEDAVNKAIIMTDNVIDKSIKK